MFDKFAIGFVSACIALGVLGLIADLPTSRCEQFGRMTGLSVVMLDRECHAIKGAQVIPRAELEKRLRSGHAGRLGDFTPPGDEAESLDMKREQWRSGVERRPPAKRM